MTAALFSLGDYSFSVRYAPPNRMARERRWPAQNRIGREPALQWTGPGEDRITLEGVIFPEHEPGRLAGLARAADTGRPLDLADGGGAWLGRYIIESLAETVPVIGPGGRPLQQEWRLVLRRYGGDGGGA